MAPDTHRDPSRDDIFDPAHYARARLPADSPDALSLPPWCYSSDAYFRREVERVFMKSWNLIGRVEKIANPGDYEAFEIAGAHAVVTRGRDGKIRAFANTCRHRGARLLQGTGNCRAIKCPYHGWVYGLDGVLNGVADMEQARNFRKEDYPLIPIRLEIWAGFMFVNFDNDAAPLSATLGDLPDKLGGYRFEDMRPTFRHEYDARCNWKIVIENFLEYYHTPTLHLRSVYRQPVDFLGQKSGKNMVVLPIEERAGDYVSFFMPHEGTRALLAGDAGFPPMAHLEGKIAKGTYSGSIFPNSMFSCHNDCMWFLEIYPLAHNRTRIVQVGCFPESTTKRADFAEVSKRYYKRWDTVMGEDAAMYPAMQQGLENPLAEAGPVCHVEDKIHDIRRRLLDRVIANR